MNDEAKRPERAFGVVPAETALTMSGLEFLRAIQRGDLPAPPISDLLDFRLREVEPGRVSFTGHPHASQHNVLGTIHGGAVSTILDSAMGCAIHTRLDTGVSYTTLELKVNFVRPVTADMEEVVAEGCVIHVGRRTATAEGRLTDQEDRLLAHATTTCIILVPPG